MSWFWGFFHLAKKSGINTYNVDIFNRKNDTYPIKIKWTNRCEKDIENDMK